MLVLVFGWVLWVLLLWEGIGGMGIAGMPVGMKREGKGGNMSCTSGERRCGGGCM